MVNREILEEIKEDLEALLERINTVLDFDSLTSYEKATELAEMKKEYENANRL